jgi:hypothetical protein
MQASVFIDGRFAVGTGPVPASMQWVCFDVGSETRLAMIRLPVPEAEGEEPQLEWSRRKLLQLIPKLRAGQSIEPAEMDVEAEASMDAIVAELEKAVSGPGGISSSFRGHRGT